MRLVIHGPQQALELLTLSHRVPQAELTEDLEDAPQEIVDLHMGDVGGPEVGVGDVGEREVADEVVCEVLDEARVVRIAELGHDLHGLVVRLEVAARVPCGRVLG